MIKHIQQYIVTLGVFFFVDLVWIQYVANRLYNNYVADILIENPRPLPAILFYLLHAFVLVYVNAQLPMTSSLFKKFTVAFLIGLTSYATYNLTNFAIIEAWHVNLLLPDILWGGILSGVSVVAGEYLTRTKDV